MAARASTRALRVRPRALAAWAHSPPVPGLPPPWARAAASAADPRAPRVTPGAARHFATRIREGAEGPSQPGLEEARARALSGARGAVTRAEYYGGDEELRKRVTIVRTEAEAEIAVAALMEATKSGAVHACDTEVMDMDLKAVGPVGHGHVTCVSVFSGPTVDYGDGPGKALWVDNLDEAAGVALGGAFKRWLEDPKERKVWHNYGFDRHVLFNGGVDALGFAGDTMHMARLADSSRDKASGGGAGYSLEALTTDVLGRRKVPMKEIFGVAKLLKSGEPSKVRTLPPIEELQRGHTPKGLAHRNEFVKYSAYDAEGTWLLYQAFDKQLQKMKWVRVESPGPDGQSSWYTMKDYFERVMVPFGEALTDMERRGIKVDTKSYLAGIEVRAKEDRSACLGEWGRWAEAVAGAEVGRHMNPQSTTQLQTFLFGGAPHLKKKGEILPTERVIQVDLAPEEVAELEALQDRIAEAEREAELDFFTGKPFSGALPEALPEGGGRSLGAPAAGAAAKAAFGLDWAAVSTLPRAEAAARLGGLKAVELKGLCRAQGCKVSGKKAELVDRLLERLCLQGDGGRPDQTAATPGAAAAADALPSAADSTSGGVPGGGETSQEVEAWVDDVVDCYTGASTKDLEVTLRGRCLSLRNVGAENLVGEERRRKLLEVVRGEHAYAVELLRLGQERLEQARRGEAPRSSALATPSWGPAPPSPSSPPPAPPAEAARALVAVAASRAAAAPTRATSAPVAAPVVVCAGSGDAALADALGDALGGDVDPAVAALRKEYETKFAGVKGRRGARRYREVAIKSLGMQPLKHTASGLPSCTADVLRGLAGTPAPPDALPHPGADPWDSAACKDAKPGAAYGFFGGGAAGRAACKALDALCRMGSIDTMLATFIEPLQKLADPEGRIHCSLNFNTETGRLSSRKPNLQNQPALEKDQYKIRDAFTCEEGNMLVVADYGQLELRLLAHMADCTSMIDAFRGGGCFHSRTAVGMFDHVKQAVDKGEVLLEWDYSKGACPSPLVKDVYGSERRKAKTLNFSIAYGKTAHGLSKDWGVSVEEAEGLLQAWYADRPEVLAWQQHMIKDARRTGFTRTLCGRYRKLNDITSANRGLRGHAERAAINTPIQGGAADVVMLAMIKINSSPTLKALGYKLLLQIHDEVILEGPEAHVEEALKEVVRCMEEPWDGSGVGVSSLKVSLDVDAKYAKTWYKAK